MVVAGKHIYIYIIYIYTYTYIYIYIYMFAFVVRFLLAFRRQPRMFWGKAEGEGKEGGVIGADLWPQVRKASFLCPWQADVFWWPAVHKSKESQQACSSQSFGVSFRSFGRTWVFLTGLVCLRSTVDMLVTWPVSLAPSCSFPWAGCS